jgi:murein DD-endopeptidase MepM/ murein hydrolase activator NlpD
MESIAAVTARIAQISAQIGVQLGRQEGAGAQPPAGSFARLLDGQLAAPTGTPAGALPATSPADAAPGTLGGLLERPAGLGLPSGWASAAGLPPLLAPSGASAASAVLTTPVEGRRTSRFGPRIHPITGARGQHTGIDLAAPSGTPIRSAAAGVVSFAGPRGGYGNLVIVDHPGGLQTYYAHQRELHVSAGTTLQAGAVLGTVGSTGRSTGPHLHFEVRRDGSPVDPAPYLRS